MSFLQSPSPSYTELEFQSIRTRLIQLCQSVFPNLELDSLAEMATLLLESNAWVSDILAYYLRLIGREARITTATQRRGLLGLVKLIGFRVPGAVAAQAVETFALAASPAAPVTFLGADFVEGTSGISVSTSSSPTPIVYQLLETIVLPAGTTIATGSNGVALPAGVIYAATTEGYAASGQINVTSSVGKQVVSYTSVTGGGTPSFNECTGGAGTLATGGAIWAIGSGTVENSAVKQDTFTSSGAANQQFLLTQTPYLDASLLVTDAVTGPYDAVENPGGWYEVPNFLSALPTDHVFTTTVDNLDRCLVTFGNGVTGAIPSGTITAAYKTGGGTAGAVAAGALTVGPSSPVDGDNNPVSLTVTNEASTPGADRYSVAQIQQLAPASLTVANRCVANSDYETVANLTPGVLRSLFLTATESPLVPWNSGCGFIVPTGGGQPTPLLLQQVLAQSTPVVGYPAPAYPKPNAFPIRWLGVDYLTINVSALVYLAKGAAPLVVGAAIRAALTAFFAPSLPDGSLNPMIDFGAKTLDQNGNPTGVFSWSVLFDLVGSVTGVLKLDPGPSGFLLNGARTDVALAAYQFPQIGAIQLLNPTTGQAF